MSWSTALCIFGVLFYVAYDGLTNSRLVIFGIVSNSFEMERMEFDTLSLVELALKLHPEKEIGNQWKSVSCNNEKFNTLFTNEDARCEGKQTCPPWR